MFKKFIQISSLMTSVLILASCTINHKPGQEFYTDIWASGKNPTYKLEGNFQGNDVYIVTPNNVKSIDEAGVLVNKNNKLVVKSLTQDDVTKIRAQLQEQQKAAQEQQRIAKLKSEQDAKQLKIQEDLVEQNRVKELRARKYSVFPSKLQVQLSSNDYGGGVVIITSVDDDPLLLERVVINNKVGVKGCDLGGYVQYMTTGDVKRIPIYGGGCGQTVVKVEVYTNRGTSSYQFR